MNRQLLEEPHARPQQTPAAFSRRLIIWLGAAALIFAAILIRSGAIPKPLANAVATKPQVILFAIRGTAQNATGPGLIAFLSVISPSARDLIILPISGHMRTATGQTLADYAAGATAPELEGEIATLTRARISGYLMFDSDFAEQVFTLLWNNTTDWPTNETPTAALTSLGWPASRPNPRQIAIIENIIGSVPELSVGSQSLLAARVLETSQTNLSPYQEFVLATFVRGEHLVVKPLRKLPPALREKQVTH